MAKINEVLNLVRKIDAEVSEIHKRLIADDIENPAPAKTPTPEPEQPV